MVESVFQSHAEIVVSFSEKKLIRVLHVDDELGLLKVAKQCLELQGPFHVDTATSVEEALNKLKEKEYDAVVSDYQMPGKDGLEFLEMLRKNGNTIPFIMFTGKGREEVAVRAWGLGADHYVNKNGDPETVYCELAHCLRSTVEKHFAEAQIKEKVQKLQTIYQNAVEGISYVDAEENIVFANKAFADIIGYEQEQLAGMSLRKIVDDENWERMENETKRRRQEESSRYEAEFRRRDGTVRNVMISGAPLLDHDGRFAGTVGIVLDITERKKTEEALRQSEEKYRGLFENARDVIVLFDLKGNVTSVNKAAEEYGFNKSGMLGKNMLKFVSKRYWPKLLKDVAQIALGKTAEGRIEIHTPKGDKMAEYRSNPIFSDNRVVGIQTILEDTTEHKKAEEDLRESEGRYNALIESINDVFFAMDRDFRYTYWNKASERLTGISAKDAIGKSLTEVFPDVEGTEVEQFYQNTLRTNQHQAFVNKYRMGDKDSVFEINAYPTKDGLSVFVKDISERKKTEETLRESEEKYRNLFESAMDAIVTLDLKGSITAVNNSVLRFGYEKEDLVGKNILDFVSKEYWPAVMRDFSKVAQGEPAKNEVELVVPAGKILVEYHAGAIVKENNVAGVQINIRDVTERKKTEELLRESEERFRGLFVSIQDPVGIFVGKEGHLIEYNAAFKKSSGYTDEELKGKVFLDFVHPDDRAMVLEKYQTKYSEEELPLVYEIRGMNKKGEAIPLELSVSAYKKKGKVIGIEVIHRDITERKKAEERLKEMNKKLEAMNEKLHVVGGLTRHDVRNKLSVMTGNAYLLRQKLVGDAKALEQLKDMEAAVRLVEKIFEFAGIYEKLGIEQLVNTEVGKVVGEAASLFSDLKGVKIVNECHGLTVLADSLLKQLFYNLIDNSLKYGGKTGQIRVYYKERSADHLELVYEDDGVGIPDNMRRSLFKEGFTSGKGTGYGLFMIKRICEVYGWTIDETGVPGKGAQFTIDIPKAKPDGRQNYELG